MASKRLTQNFVQTVKPPKIGQLEYFDNHPQGGGVGLRVGYGGKKTWFVLYRFQGRQRRLTLGEYPAITLARAREKALEARTAIAEGNDPASEKQGASHGLTFSEVVDHYLTYLRPQLRPSTYIEYERIVKKYLALWDKRPVRSITREDVESLFNSIDGKVQANRVLTLVKTIFAYALDEEWVDRNPASHRRLKPHREMPRDRVLSAAELRSVWQASADLPQDIRDVVRILILLGQRIGETLRMRWSDINLEDAKWTIPAAITKSKRTHVLPLSHAAVAILRSRRGNTFSDYVFPGPSVNAPRSRIRPSYWRKLEEASGVTGAPFTAHDLRRTMASGMPEHCQVPPHVVSRLLNHVQAGVTNQVYNQYSYLPEMREALEEWADFVVTNGHNNVVLMYG